VGLTGKMLLFTALMFLSKAFAEPKVVATVDSNNVGLGEVVQLTLSISSDSQMSLGDIRLPPLEGFDLLNSSVSQSARQMIINGQMEMVLSQNYIYLLQTNKTGTLLIPAIEVAVNSQTYRTNEIKIIVGKQGQKPAQRAQPQPDEEDEDPFFEDADSLFQQLLKRHGLNSQGQRGGSQVKINPDEAFMIRLEADKNEAYVGEQITASWWLYTRNSIQNIDTLKYPNLRGFFKEDIEVATRLDWQQEVINGIPYRKALLVSYALFPLKEGTSLIDAYKARCTVIAGGGVFGFGQSYTFTKASPEIKVKVKPIPSAGRPSDFAGGVGQFQMRAIVDTKNVATNQPFPLKIRFEGKGNAKSIDLPTLNLPKSLEVYSQRDETKFNRDGTSFKEFELLLIPRETGKVVIPKITMSFFNPVSGSFYSNSTEEITLNVGQGREGVTQNVGPMTSPTASKKEYVPELVTYWESYKEVTWWQRLTGWIVVYVLILLFIFWRFVVELQIGARRKSISTIMSRRLKSINALISKQEWRKVGTELTNTIYLVVGAIAGEDGGSSVQLEKLFEHLAPSLKKEFESSIKSLLSRCETLSFAPSEVVGNLKESNALYDLKKEVEALLARFIKASSAAKDQ